MIITGQELKKKSKVNTASRTTHRDIFRDWGLHCCLCKTECGLFALGNILPPAGFTKTSDMSCHFSVKLMLGKTKSCV